MLHNQELSLENNIKSIQISAITRLEENNDIHSQILQRDNTNDIDNINENMDIDKVDDNIQNIFFDDVKFNQLLEYSCYINTKLHPANWLELNDQLFCPVKFSQTLNSQNTISNADERLLRALYKLQFKENCFDESESNRFLVFDMKTMGTRGLGAVINAGLLRIMFRAMYSNRTLILSGKWMWTKKRPYCLHANTTKQIRGMSCYALPTSNCNYLKLIKHFGVEQEYRGRIPLHCDIGDNKSLPLCKERIITINKRGDGWGYFPMPSSMDRWLLSHYKANYNTFRAVTTSFFFRLTANVRKIIYNKLKNAWRNSLAIYNKSQYINPFLTVSLPIRHSDKCNVQGHVGGEMECWREEEYILFLNTVSVLSNNKISTVIITSESTQFINNLTAQIKQHPLTNNNKWRIIVNADDISSQVGASDYVDNAERYEQWLAYSDDRLGTQMEFDPIVGALSSMLLQISNSKYIVHTKSSNWLDLIWALGKHLNCESIFWSLQFEINDLFVDQDHGHIDMNDIYNEKRPKFMHNLNKRYLHFEKYCFEFIQWGLANKLVYRKSITYPPDLWETIKQHFKSDSKFEKQFGIRSKTFGPCDRYNMPPYQRSDTLY